jgi:hypothetical protein
MKRLIVIACATVAALAAFAIPAAVAAPPPATLTGENFADPGAGSAFCMAAGNFSFTASGAAIGPYPGTFTETGTGTLAGTGPGVHPVTAFTASFTIHSPTGDLLVTGTKALTAPGTGCLDPTLDSFFASAITTTYGATIYTATGNYHDEGASLISSVGSLARDTVLDTVLGEFFSSSLLEPVLISPTSKDQCKDGGWETYPQFEKQGDCVSFVATGGKNPPGKK